LSTAAPLQRLTIYAGLNLAFFLVVGFAYASGGAQDPRILYLVLLFALCSAPLIDLDGLNGRYALLGIFLFSYFVMFGLSDLFALVNPPNGGGSAAVLTATEAVILVGGFVVYLCYRLVVAVHSAATQSPVRLDWSMRAILLVGLSMWAIGTYATYHWYVYIVTGTTNEAVRRGIQSENTYVISAYILAQMMQPLGILLIAYLWRVYRPAYLWSLVLGIVMLQVVLGFIGELKGLAMLGGILVIATVVLIENRVPKLWLSLAIVYAMFVFPIFQAYRAEVSHNRGIARTTVVADLGRALELSLAAEHRVYSGRERAQTFLERVSLLGSVQMIVEKTGISVPYQHGYTLTPILATFVPKVVWSDKPDVPTGQLVNRSFHVTDSDDVFISPSHLGELYWNFGWWGVVLGMSIIGGILGLIGCAFNLAHGRTITRVLVTVVTIKQLIAGFESSIATIYVVWLRSLVGIGILHLIFARLPVTNRLPARRRDSGGSAPAGRDDTATVFHNLLS